MTLYFKQCLQAKKIGILSEIENRLSLLLRVGNIQRLVRLCPLYIIQKKNQNWTGGGGGDWRWICLYLNSRGGKGRVPNYKIV